MLVQGPRLFSAEQTRRNMEECWTWALEPFFSSHECLVFQKLLVIWISKVKHRGWERGRGRERERRESETHYTTQARWRSEYLPFTLQPPITSLSVLTHTCTFSQIGWYLLAPNSNLKLRNWWSGRRRVSLDRRAAVSNRVAIKKIARGGQKQTETSGDRRRREKERKTASGDRVAMEAHGMRD